MAGIGTGLYFLPGESGLGATCPSLSPKFQAANRDCFFFYFLFVFILGIWYRVDRVCLTTQIALVVMLPHFQPPKGWNSSRHVPPRPGTQSQSPSQSQCTQAPGPALKARDGAASPSLHLPNGGTLISWPTRKELLLFIFWQYQGWDLLGRCLSH